MRDDPETPLRDTVSTVLTPVLDAADQQLLNLVQTGVPLARRPYQELARALECSEEQVIGRLGELRRPPRPLIRQISGIFDSKALGYQSTLVAARVEPSRLERAAAEISSHPGVTHNYERDHEYNLWYTLGVPPDSRLGLEGTLDVLHRRSGAVTTRMFPTLRLYKIGVSFDLGAESAGGGQLMNAPAFSDADRQQATRFAITHRDRQMIRVLQQDLPIVERPFDVWAEEAGVHVAELLTAARAYLRQRRMRRFSAVLHHRRAGIAANAMGAWAVPPGREDEFGVAAAGFPAVSHCYLRPTYPDWPYSVFTMVHGKTPGDCEATLAAIASATGVNERVALYSTREFKKTRLKYFAGDIELWEESVLGKQSN